MRYRAVIRLAAASRPTRLLDVGCGEGNLERMIMASGLHFERAVGIDIDRARLVRAKDKQMGHVLADFIRADAENLPIRPGCFDVVIATEVLEHVPNEALFLQELRRLAIRRAVITVPALRYPSFLVAIGSEGVQKWVKTDSRFAASLSGEVKLMTRWMAEFLFPLFLVRGIVRTRRMRYYDFWLYHGNVPHRLYTTQYLIGILKANGFRVESVEGVGFTLPLTAEIELGLRRVHLYGVASFFAWLQTLLNEKFARKEDRSQNIVVLCSDAT